MKEGKDDLFVMEKLQKEKEILLQKYGDQNALLLEVCDLLQTLLMRRSTSESKSVKFAIEKCHRHFSMNPQRRWEMCFVSRLLFLTFILHVYYVLQNK